MNLKYEKEDIYSSLNEKELKDVDNYCDNYLEFLNKGKTEYLCVKEAKKMLSSEGFIEIQKVQKLKAGDKVFFVNKDKSLFVSIIGKDSLVNGVNIIGAHIDSPRIDIKPMPLYENHDIALLKTQYYGGIKKYQWMSIPLAMYGVVYTQKQEKIEIAIGDDKNDPCFTMADLLPHLAKDQMKANANEFIDPEKMSVIIGNLKDKDKDLKKDSVKMAVLKILNQKYGIKEIDFARSEISFVPAFIAKYVGIDKSMIGGYGQDDRVCSYATIKAICDISKDTNQINKTIFAVIVDKEEIGSVGNTSMESKTFDMFVNKIIKKTGEENVDLMELFYNSKMLSADVATAVDPVYDEVSDIQNSNIMGCRNSTRKI
ncbi:MAG: aminopeptidase [Clostridia bacterium]